MFDDFDLEIQCEEYYDEDMYEFRRLSDMDWIDANLDKFDSDSAPFLD